MDKTTFKLDRYTIVVSNEIEVAESEEELFLTYRKNGEHESCKLYIEDGKLKICNTCNWDFRENYKFIFFITYVIKGNEIEIKVDEYRHSENT